MAKLAIIKFNGGRGALLCQKCGVVIATGFEHEDKIHFCDKCSPAKSQPHNAPER